MTTNWRSSSSTPISTAIKAAVWLAALGIAPSALAQVAVSPVTGHAYERVLEPMTWYEARTAALGRLRNGKHGYLATIRTAEEQNITRFGLGGDTGGCWLGGKQISGPEPAGGWVWDNGEPWGTTQWVDLFWQPGEPNNYAGWTGHEEDAMMVQRGGGVKLWDDWWSGDSNPANVYGYIVEWNCLEVSVLGFDAASRCPGGTVSFSVAPVGDGPFTYAWSRGGVPINTIANPSAATATLTLSNLALSDAGTYLCAVTNACETAHSAAFNLYVDSPASVTMQPANVSVCPSGTATFAFQVNGGGASTSYQWRKGLAPIDTSANPSAATATLILLDVQLTDADDYDCIVTNTCGSVTSNPAQLLVDPSDMGRQGGIPGRDGLHDNNDFVAFIDLFFDQQPAADIGKQGGILGSDGQFDNNDFIVFIDQFFAAC